MGGWMGWLMIDVKIDGKKLIRWCMMDRWMMDGKAWGSLSRDVFSPSQHLLMGSEKPTPISHWMVISSWFVWDEVVSRCFKSVTRSELMYLTAAFYFLFLFPSLSPRSNPFWPKAWWDSGLDIACCAALVPKLRQSCCWSSLILWLLLLFQHTLPLPPTAEKKIIEFIS